MVFVLYVLIFFFGAAMGSFAGVIIERGREELSRSKIRETFGGRSYCPSCKKTLSVDQLIPLFGWLSQRGSCKYCGKSIPSWYMWLEAAMGTVFVLTFVILVGGEVTAWLDAVYSGDRGLLCVLIARLLFNWTMLSLVFADLLWYELNVYMWIFSVLTGGFLLWSQTTGGWPLIITGLVYGITLCVIYFLIYLLGRWMVYRKTGKRGEGMGQGDVYLAFTIGMLSVLRPFTDQLVYVQLICWFLIVSSLLGAIYRVVGVYRTGDRQMMIPFIPAMILARYVLYFWGDLLLGLFV